MQTAHEEEVLPLSYEHGPVGSEVASRSSTICAPLHRVGLATANRADKDEASGSVERSKRGILPAKVNA